MVKNVLILGASGMVGGTVLKKLLLNHREINRVTAIVRKPLDLNDDHCDEKLIQVVHEDFLNFDPIKKHFEEIDLAFFCLGVYTGTVSRNMLRRVTVDMAKSFTDCLINSSSTKNLGNHSHRNKTTNHITVIFLSSWGVNGLKKSIPLKSLPSKFRELFTSSYIIDKTLAENYLFSKSEEFNQSQKKHLKKIKPYFFRPGYIYPLSSRKEHNIYYLITQKLYPILKWFDPLHLLSLTSGQLANAMIHVGFHGYPKPTQSNREIFLTASLME